MRPVQALLIGCGKLGHKAQPPILKPHCTQMGKGQHLRHQIARLLGRADGLLQGCHRLLVLGGLAIGCAQGQGGQTNHSDIIEGHQFQPSAGGGHAFGGAALGLEQVGLERQTFGMQILGGGQVRIHLGQRALGMIQIGRDLPEVTPQQVHPGKIQIGAGADGPPLGR